MDGRSEPGEDEIRAQKGNWSCLEVNLLVLSSGSNLLSLSYEDMVSKCRSCQFKVRPSSTLCLVQRTQFRRTCTTPRKANNENAVSPLPIWFASQCEFVPSNSRPAMQSVATKGAEGVEVERNSTLRSSIRSPIQPRRLDAIEPQVRDHLAHMFMGVRQQA